MAKKETEQRFAMTTEDTATPKQNAMAKKACKTLQRKIGSGNQVGRPKKK